MRITEQGEVVSFKYANRGTAQYQIELLAASVVEHSLKSEREKALVPTAEFDEAMEALSGAAQASYRQLIDHPDLLPYYQAASPLEELSMLNLGSRPARRFGARSLPDRSARANILALVEEEYHRTVEAVLRISRGRELVERYPRFRRRLARRLPTINQVSRQQIELLRRFRESGGDKTQEEQLSALLLSINTIAAGFGATG
jgi:phosphoenolpyruvate carboxylase